VQALAVVEDLDVVEDLAAGLGAGGELLPITSSSLRVLQKLSMAALS